MSEWTGIVYARTHAVDFRYLALPPQIEPRRVDGALAVVLRQPERLRDSTSWCLIRDERWCLFGAACMVRDLVAAVASPPAEGAPDLTRDRHRRPTFAFFGWAAPVSDATELDLPSYEAGLSVFAPLLDVVRGHWLEQDWQVGSKPADHRPLLEGEAWPALAAGGESGGVGAESPLPDEAAGLIRLLPDGEEVRRTLWAAAAAAARTGRVSLAFGVPGEAQLAEAPFANATIAGLDEPKTIPRVSCATSPASADTTRAGPEERSDAAGKAHSKDKGASPYFLLGEKVNQAIDCGALKQQLTEIIRFSKQLEMTDEQAWNVIDQCLQRNRNASLREVGDGIRGIFDRFLNDWNQDKHVIALRRDLHEINDKYRRERENRSSKTHIKKYEHNDKKSE